MNFRRLWHLHLIIEKGSFSAAARHAGVSQPALSKSMKLLQDELGVRLFERVGRRQVPTNAALQAARTASRLHAELDAVAAAGPVQGIPAQQRTGAVLRVGLAPAAAFLYGPCIQAIWQAREPEGFVEFVGGSGSMLINQLRSRQLDFIIAPQPRREVVTDLFWLHLHRSTPTVYARADHPLRNVRSLHGIRHAGWAVAGHADTAGSVIEEAHRVRKLARPRILAQCQDYRTMLNLVACSDLLCVVPYPTLLTGLVNVRPLNIGEGLPHYDVGMFWLRTQSQPNLALIRAVVPALKALRAVELQSPAKSPTAGDCGHVLPLATGRSGAPPQRLA
jgi:DNA-binding transcriptional LysR family regulator